MPDVERQAAERPRLSQRNVVAHRDVVAQVGEPRISHDADDFNLGAGLALAREPAPDGVLALQKRFAIASLTMATRWLPSTSLSVNSRPLHEGHTESRDVAGSDAVDHRIHVLAGGRVVSPHSHRLEAVPVHHRRHRRDRHRGDTGDRRQFLAQPAGQRKRLRAVIAVERSVHAQLQQSVGDESGVHGAEVVQTSREQTGASDQQQRQRHLAHNQRTKETRLLPRHRARGR
jgi:hypothetical protein